MIFPPCQFAGRLINQRKRFCQLKDPRPVSLSTCLACPHAGKISDRLEPICGPQPRREISCVHRGAVLRSVGCELCGTLGQTMRVHACEIHGECTPSRWTDKRTAPKVCTACRDRTGPEPDLPPLEGPANLMMSFYPRRETRHIWERQQEVIREAIDRFDGQKLCAIACDDSTAENEIDRSLWDDVIELENDRERWELPGWQWAMERLASEPGFTVRLHAKGAVRGAAEKHLQSWWELGFAAMLDVDAVRRSLDSAIITGPFRRFGFAHNLGVDWHYSGSFYAFRNAEIFAREWMPDSRGDASHYVEAWPAMVASKAESDCLRYDGVGDLYASKNWKAAA